MPAIACAVRTHCALRPTTIDEEIAVNDIAHALVLNLHQPAGNLEHLLAGDEWAAKEILFALDRIPRALWDHESTARVHLSLSGTLLETLSSPGFQARVYGIVDCGSLLWHLQNRRIIEILGTAYYHPVLPLIPAHDRATQLERWRGIASHLFWRNQFAGFWPPEMGFCMELIPQLVALGYRYVIVDSEHVEPLSTMRWEEVRYRPHVARHGDAAITVIVRDRELSAAQESGMELDWFTREVHERTRFCDFTPLVTTSTDGDNGGWFRNTNLQSNFWGAFYHDLLRRGAATTPAIRPVFITDYLDRHGVAGEVRVRTGAWNTGWHHGRDFMQWTGSDAQKHALGRVAQISGELHSLRMQSGAGHGRDAALEHATWRLLRAETSCNFFWGEDWVGRCHADLDAAEHSLRELRAGA
jgi:alpha-amylase/alpha-mannosidase (GH57 family)